MHKLIRTNPKDLVLSATVTIVRYGYGTTGSGACETFPDLTLSITEPKCCCQWTIVSKIIYDRSDPK